VVGRLKYSPCLGPELRRQRRLLRLSQAEVATICGLTQRQISRYANNTVAGPDAANILRMGTVYGLSPNQVATLGGWWSGEPDGCEILVNSISLIFIAFGAVDGN
jgi:transcriptional regulator with XRE-family HTH domain